MLLCLELEPPVLQQSCGWGHPLGGTPPDTLQHSGNPCSALKALLSGAYLRLVLVYGLPI